MKKDELQRKIIQQWGAKSSEATTFKDVYRKCLKWERYEYEKYGLGMHSDEPEPRNTGGRQHNTNTKSHSIELPKENDIFRATWSYFLARAAFIFMMWIIFLVVMILLFWGIYAAVDPPSWEEVKTRRGIEQHRIIR